MSLVGSDEKIHVKILCDTGAFDSFILASALLFSEETNMDSFILVLVICLNVLHKIMLYSDLFQGEVAVGVGLALPMEGVTMILGNDVAVSHVWPDVSPPAIVAAAPMVSSDPDRKIVCLHVLD